MSEDKLDACVAMCVRRIRRLRSSDSWDELKGEQILAAMEHQDLIMKEEMEHLMEEHDHDLMITTITTMIITIMSIAVTTT